jgi:hypothetical protein
MSQIKLGTGVYAHYHTSGENYGICQSCYSTNLTPIGVLSVNGTDQDVVKCNSCNKLSTSVNSGVQSLINEATTTFPEADIGYTTLITNGIGTISSNSFGSLNSSNTVTIGNLPPDHGWKFDQMNTKLENIDNNINSLRIVLEQFANKVEDLAKQNVQLMEKLATDPLNGMRKAISSFNLE